MFAKGGERKERTVRREDGTYLSVEGGSFTADKLVIVLNVIDVASIWAS
jgi:hypothetical protein